MAHQKGPEGDNLLGAKNPSLVQSNSKQAETKSPLAFTLDTGEGKLPKITLETKQSGQVGSLDVNKTSEGTRSKSDIVDSFGPDQNLRDQWIQS